MKDVLDFLKRTLLDGLPVVFGFTVFDSIDDTSYANKFGIPFPSDHDDGAESGSDK